MNKAETWGLFDQIKDILNTEDFSYGISNSRLRSIENLCNRLEQRLAEAERDAVRFRYLTLDLAAAEMDRRNEILYRMPVMSYSSASTAIDAEIAAITAPQQEQEGEGRE